MTDQIVFVFILSVGVYLLIQNSIILGSVITFFGVVAFYRTKYGFKPKKQARHGSGLGPDSAGYYDGESGSSNDGGGSGGE